MYLLCDIDGVHIPFPGPDGEIPEGFQAQFVVPTGYSEPVRIWLNPETGDILLDAMEGLSLTPLWCSSWRADSAPMIGASLGLPTWKHVELPRLPLTTSHPSGYLWKRDTVAALVSGGQDLIWIDDDFTPADHLWARQRTDNGANTVLIQPDPYKGLRQADLEPLAQLAARRTDLVPPSTLPLMVGGARSISSLS